MSVFTDQAGAPLRRRAIAVAGIAAAAIFSTTVAARASEIRPHSTVTSSRAASSGSPQDAGPIDAAGLAELEAGLRVISDIPDTVLEQGEQALKQWLAQHAPDEAASEGGRQKRSFNAGGCARGILLAVGSNIFAVAKIYKMKKAIDKLGGAGKVAKRLQAKKKMGKNFKKGLMEVFEEAGSGLGGIAAEILGVDGVIKHCW